MTAQLMLPGHAGPPTVVPKYLFESRSGATADLTEGGLVRTAVEAAGWVGIVLPMVRHSGFRGYPVIKWIDDPGERLRQGWGPELDRPTLSMWESWPPDVPNGPPPSVLRIVGFVSASTWRPALRGVREMCGYGAGMVLIRYRPSWLRLAEAELAGLWVVRASPAGEANVLVEGRREPVPTARRVVSTRYWEEFLFAHALRRSPSISPPEKA